MSSHPQAKGILAMMPTLYASSLVHPKDGSSPAKVGKFFKRDNGLGEMANSPDG
jgi:hypothetical protein